jgi:hypothetical protein
VLDTGLAQMEPISSAPAQSGIGQLARPTSLAGDSQSIERTDSVSAGPGVPGSLLGSGLLDAEALGSGLLWRGTLDTGLVGVGSGVSGPGVAGPGAGGTGAEPVVSPGAPSSQAQYHDQFQSQSSPLPAPAVVVISVVSLHQVNVQTQSHGVSLVPCPVSGCPVFCPVFVCVTGPSSPGLSTRTDTLTFAGPVSGPPDPRSSLGAPLPGLVGAGVASSAAECDGSHDQFHAQSQIQSRDEESPLSIAVDDAIPSQIVSSHVQIHGAISLSVTLGASLLFSD